MMILLSAALVPARAADREDYSQLMKVAGDEAFKGTRGLRQTPSAEKLAQTLDAFLARNERIWALLVDELEIRLRQNKNLKDDQEILRRYAQWYLYWSDLLARLQITPVQLDKLRAHTNQILIPYMEFRTGVGELDRAIIDDIKFSETILLRGYQANDFAQKRQVALELLLAGPSVPRSELRAHLSSIAKNLTTIQYSAYLTTPRDYEWLVGLGELMMDFDTTPPGLVAPEAIESRETRSERLFSAYLDAYAEMAPLLTSDKSKSTEVWAYRLLIVPLAHIVSLDASVPHASKRAGAMLREIQKRARSPYLSRRAQDILAAVRSAPPSQSGPLHRRSPPPSTVTVQRAPPSWCQALLSKWRAIRQGVN